MFVEKDICDELPDISRGSVTLTGAFAGAIATYRCRTGFFLVNNRRRTCLSSGQWDGEEPECRSKQKNVPIRAIVNLHLHHSHSCN